MKSICVCKNMKIGTVQWESIMLRSTIKIDYYLNFNFIAIQPFLRDSLNIDICHLLYLCTCINLICYLLAVRCRILIHICKKKKIYFNLTKLGYNSYMQIYHIYFLLYTYILVLQ